MASTNAYKGLAGYNTAFDALSQQQDSLGSNDRAGLDKRLESVGNEFSTLFANLVGRAPNTYELNQFFRDSGGSVILNSPMGRSESNATDVNNQIRQYVGDAFQKTAQDYATEQLKGQQSQADDLANLFRTQGNKAISDTESSLLDYQSKLFDRLRPNLITSLKAQGLLDTGGMNEALAGQQGDLANSAANYVAQLKLQNENAANAISFGGAAAPYYFQQANIVNTPDYLKQQGNMALSANTNTFMDNLNFNHQMALIHQQAQDQMGMQPSFLRTLGQSTANGLGAGFGKAMGEGAQAGLMSMMG